MIGEIFYTLFIWPARFILEFFFVLFTRISSSPGLALILLSAAANTILLPINLASDRWQKEDRDLRNRMKKKLHDIRAVYSGDKRQMIINTYYRQMGYSPLMTLKSSAGLLLQIPFFVAAYQLLSSTRMLSGVSLFFIKDLSAPDAHLSLPFSVFGITALNILPILMTAINLLSAFIYAKDFGKRERIQLFGMALLFLILLYRSPSGLVLYWTLNNLYSLIKNTAISYMKKPGRVLQIAAAIAAFVFIFFIWSGKANVERFRMLFAGIAVLIGLVPFLLEPLVKLLRVNKEQMIELSEKNIKETNVLFFSSSIMLFLLLGLLNPAQVLSSSVSDFDNPWSFFFHTALQGFSFFILIPLFIRSLAPQSFRRILSLIWPTLSLICLICYFGLSSYYGVMDRNFRLDDTERLLYAFPLWVSLVVPLAAAIIVMLIFAFKKIRIFAYLFHAGCAAILFLVCVDLITLGNRHAELSLLRKNDEQQNGELQDTMPVYFPISENEKNVFIISLDRAQGSAMLDALEYIPSLNESFDGFVFYPNTLSFGNCTVIGVPAMLGGYNYTPEAINSRKDESLVDKVNSAITLMPRAFSEAGYRVTITDTVIANMRSVPDISIFNDMPNVNARLLSGKLSNRYRAEFPASGDEGSDPFDFDILFRYGLFRAAPPALRYGIYYKGQWWREAAYNSYGRAIGEFSSLYYLPQMSKIDSGPPSLNIFMNFITHEGGSYNADLVPQNTPVVFSDNEIALYGSKENAQYMYTLLSAMNQITKWLNYLKGEGVYDNTRIIVVSDHGGHYRNGQDTAGMEGFNPLLMVKDFESRGLLRVSEEFMTHSDTPYLAAVDLPALSETAITMRNEAEQAKAGTIAVFSAVSSQPLRHGPYGFNLSGKRELKEKEVFKSESWGDWKRN